MKSIPPERKIELLGQLLSAEEGSRGASADRLKDIIEKELSAALRDPVPPDILGLYAEQQKTLGEFRSFLQRGPVVGKRVVAIGGSFSSGKSTFLNMLLGGPSLLPTDLLRTTAVPSYLIKGDDEHGEGINLLGSAVRLAPDDIASLAHSADGSAELPLGSILKCIFIFTPRMPYSHIALLDTPGYSDAGSAGSSGHTDRDIAYRQLCGSDAILWFVPADHGTLQQDDITFLKSLPPDIPKAVVVSKADKPQDRSELDDVVRAVRSALERGGISCGQIFVLSRRKGAPSDLEKIRSYIKSMDSAAETPDFAVRFRKIFRSCRDFYDRRISEGKQRLSSLNRPLTLAEDGSGAAQCLQGIAAETKKEIRSCEDAISRIEAVRQSFFTELRRIGDQAGIKMPDPDEIDRSEASNAENSWFKRILNAADQVSATAAGNGDADAQFRHGDPYYNGSSVSTEYHSADWFYEGEKYYYGRGVRQDYAEAAKCYRKSADLGNADAEYSLGHMHAFGQGVRQDNEEALRWFSLAAAHGNAKARERLIRLKGASGSAPRAGTAQGTSGTSESGDSDWYYQVAENYYYGRGVSQDYAEAAESYRKAAEQGNANAQYSLGHMYLFGLGVRQDSREAANWFQKAAERGNSAARKRLKNIRPTL